MHKRFAILVLLLVGCICLSSCSDFMQQSGLKQYLSADPSLQGTVQHLSYGETDGFYTVSYGGCIYRGVPNSIFCYDDGKVPKDELVMIGWLSRFLYRTYYYSYTTQAPVYLIDTFTDVTYLREDFDYMSEVFILDKTNEEVTLSMVIGEPLNRNLPNSQKERITIVLHAKEYPLLRARLTLARYDGKYVLLSAEKEMYTISDTFVEILKENGMITQ